jgi:hypothetical protein
MIDGPGNIDAEKIIQPPADNGNEVHGKHEEDGTVPQKYVDEYLTPKSDLVQLGKEVPEQVDEFVALGKVVPENNGEKGIPANFAGLGLTEQAKEAMKRSTNPTNGSLLGNIEKQTGIQFDPKRFNARLSDTKNTK